MKYKKLTNGVQIPQNEFVSVKKMGNVTEIMYNSHRNTKAQTIKIDKETYYVSKTGEVKEYQKKSENRSQSTESMRKTMNRIKELVQTNVTDNTKIRWVTLTYKENMNDCQKLYQDFRKFNQRFQRYLAKRELKKAEYICVVEPQQRGAWHCHIIYIWETKAPFIPNDDLCRLWGKGFTKITKFDNCDNIAVYLTAYLSDIEIKEDVKEYFDKEEIKARDIDGQKKYFVKGGRLHMYPCNFNILRHSQGIKYPKTERMRLNTALECVKGKSLTYESTFELSDESGFSTVIDKKEYR